MGMVTLLTVIITIGTTNADRVFIPQDVQTVTHEFSTSGNCDTAGERIWDSLKFASPNVRVQWDCTTFRDEFVPNTNGEYTMAIVSTSLDVKNRRSNGRSVKVEFTGDEYKHSGFCTKRAVAIRATSQKFAFANPGIYTTGVCVAK